MNTLYNEDCFDTIKRLNDENKKIDIVLTSPPYNTGYCKNDKRGYHSRYNGKYNDNKNDKEYINWITDLINNIDNILVENGVILLNLSYSANKPYLYIQLLNNIIENTNYCIADTIAWKKKHCMVDNSSPNRLSRITEFVFVICRKNELKTFKTNKKYLFNKGNQRFFSPMYNHIEANNNDGSTKLNKATFSSELICKLLSMYANKDSVVYDCFMGTGTTAIGCIKYGCNYLGSEIDTEQYDFSIDRIKKWNCN